VLLFDAYEYRKSQGENRWLFATLFYVLMVGHY